MRSKGFSFQDQAEKASLEEIVKNHDNSKKREAKNLSKMQEATAIDSKILEHTKPKLYQQLKMRLFNIKSLTQLTTFLFI